METVVIDLDSRDDEYQDRSGPLAVLAGLAISTVCLAVVAPIVFVRSAWSFARRRRVKRQAVPVKFDIIQEQAGRGADRPVPAVYPAADLTGRRGKL